MGRPDLTLLIHTILHTPVPHLLRRISPLRVPSHGSGTAGAAALLLPMVIDHAADGRQVILDYLCCAIGQLGDEPIQDAAGHGLVMPLRGDGGGGGGRRGERSGTMRQDKAS